MVELQPSKLDVAGSNPAARSTSEEGGRKSGSRETESVDSRAASGEGRRQGASGSQSAHVAQLAERVLGKDEVTSSNLVVGSSSGRVQLWAVVTCK